PHGHFLIASEGDNNKRPRVPPRIFEVDAEGKWLRDLKLPEVLIPEALGQTKKGVSNNFSIEAMALSKEGTGIWFTTEKPLVQDITLESDKSPYRLFYFDLKTGKSEQYFFEAPEMEEQTEGVVLVRGWTEIIHLGDKKFWLLERSL